MSFGRGVQDESIRRAGGGGAAAIAGKPRQKHLLSGSVRCALCGSGHVISGKDYYRCASQKERGTCRNTVSVRKAPLETAVLPIMKGQLLRDRQAKLFVNSFASELKRLGASRDERREADDARLAELQIRLSNFGQNSSAGMVSPMLVSMINEAEAAKTALTTR
jgi:site-specific DNA recombinase